MQKRPGVRNMIDIYVATSSDDAVSPEIVVERFKNADLDTFKSELATTISVHLAPIQVRF